MTNGILQQKCEAKAEVKWYAVCDMVTHGRIEGSTWAHILEKDTVTLLNEGSFLLFEKRGSNYGSQRARRKGRMAKPVGTGHRRRSGDVLTLPKSVASSRSGWA